MLTSAQEQHEKLFTPGNSQTQLGTKELVRLSHTDLLPLPMSMILSSNWVLEAALGLAWPQTQRQMILSD